MSEAKVPTDSEVAEDPLASPAVPKPPAIDATSSTDPKPPATTKKRAFSAYQSSGRKSPKGTRYTPVMPGRSILSSTFGKVLSKTLGKAVGKSLGKALGKFANSRTKIGKTLAKTACTALGTPRELLKPPSPPTEAPPSVEHLIPIMVVGPQGSGKSCLVKSWVERLEPQFDDDQDDISDDELWCMDYYKKDFAFSTPEQKDHSVRVQLWDCFGMGPEVDDDDGYEDWEKVAKTVDTILLTVALDEKPDVEDIIDQIEYWKTWLDEKLGKLGEGCPAVELLLTKADRVQIEKRKASLLEWMEPGAKLDQLCQEYKIPAWHVVTARYGDIPHGVETVDDLFCSIVEKRLKAGSSFFKRAAAVAAAAASDEEEMEEDELEPLDPPAKRRRLEQPPSKKEKDTEETSLVKDSVATVSLKKVPASNTKSSSLKEVTTTPPSAEKVPPTPDSLSM